MARKHRGYGDLIMPVTFVLVSIEMLNPGIVTYYLKIAGVVLVCILFAAIAYRFLSQKKHEEDKSISRSTAINLPVSDAFPIVKKIPKTENPKKWTLDLIKTLEWKSFEILCAEYFKATGYAAFMTTTGADGGIDIRLKKNQEDGADQKEIYVQCKAWPDRNVGVKPVRELYGVMAADGIRSGIFITSRGYTNEALSFSLNKELDLITGDKILQMIQNLSKDEQDRLFKIIYLDDYTTPTCPSCDVKMVERVSKKRGHYGSRFWGCINYPRCHQTLRVRSQ